MSDLENDLLSQQCDESALFLDWATSPLKMLEERVEMWKLFVFRKVLLFDNLLDTNRSCGGGFAQKNTLLVGPVWKVKSPFKTCSIFGPWSEAQLQVYM